MTEKSKLKLIKKAENRFFYDWNTNMIHDRQCAELINMSVYNMDAVDFLTPRYVAHKNFCPQCKRKVAIRNGMRGRLRTSSEQMRFFMDFFQKADARTQDLSRLFIFEGGTLECVSRDCVEIRVKEDAWRITAPDDGLTLFHNDYLVNDDHSRTFTGRFHVQGGPVHPSFHHCARAMIQYSFDYHKRGLEAYDNKVRLLHFEAGLAIASNYVCCDRKSLLYAYYTFIDIPADGSARPKIHGMKILERTEKDGYAVITCRIPRWRRREFELAMGILKDRAYDERRFDYLNVCENAVPQPA